MRKLGCKWLQESAATFVATSTAAVWLASSGTQMSFVLPSFAKGPWKVQAGHVRRWQYIDALTLSSKLKGSFLKSGTWKMG